MNYGLAVDGVLVLLLVVTICYCATLNRRLGALRAAQDEMKRLAATFNDATARAETSIMQLKTAAEDAFGELDPKMRSARELIGDLDMLNHRANKLIKRLDPTTEAPARKSAPRAAPAQPDPSPRRGPAREAPAARSRAEKELIQAIKAAN